MTTPSLAGKVALVTGAARGNGRAIAAAFGAAGADVLIADIARSVDGVPYAGATGDDLEETRALVEKHGVRCHAVAADVRDIDQLRRGVAAAVEHLGGLDVVVPNAGILSGGVPTHELSEQQWSDLIAVNLTGAWNTVRAAVPALLDRGSGAVTFVASGAALGGIANFSHYVTAKHGIVGLMRAVAAEYGPANIRSNAVCPTAVDTPMTRNSFYTSLFTGGQSESREAMLEALRGLHLLPISVIEAEDVANAVVWISSPAARYVTGTVLPVDAGNHIKL
ncbi:mycofactocin-coupled SDR family oxidoreductase [Acrocarpospora catenulata]|uniref:mycofactocin-coupled SDR family oxidoreductase n=1 Tax=Acrocarpospora catenulata TaxID=2836182 RepID=UPI001BD91EC5|nr:mycofactocin-coupled SDR family oxidoreductase [Acrocarpospora catenulata]